jgi:hypothetical protein
MPLQLDVSIHLYITSFHLVNCHSAVAAVAVRMMPILRCVTLVDVCWRSEEWREYDARKQRQGGRHWERRLELLKGTGYIDDEMDLEGSQPMEFEGS